MSGELKRDEERREIGGKVGSSAPLGCHFAASSLRQQALVE